MRGLLARFATEGGVIDREVIDLEWLPSRGPIASGAEFGEGRVQLLDRCRPLTLRLPCIFRFVDALG